MNIPTVHLNGTSFEELARQADNAAAALRKASDALSNMAPNGRDYYVQGDGAINEAMADHCSRMAILRSLIDHVAEIQMGIYDQQR